ncbi:MAG: hypothetical protein C0611_10155 [Desulfobacteraceae bacterium]|nr:MAG: hypothetical protein C0611_10155 [Desulfobacteraceae bacterium]
MLHISNSINLQIINISDIKSSDLQESNRKYSPIKRDLRHTAWKEAQRRNWTFYEAVTISSLTNHVNLE